MVVRADGSHGRCCLDVGKAVRSSATGVPRCALPIPLHRRMDCTRLIRRGCRQLIRYSTRRHTGRTCEGPEPMVVLIRLRRPVGPTYRGTSARISDRRRRPVDFADVKPRPKAEGRSCFHEVRNPAENGADQPAPNAAADHERRRADRHYEQHRRRLINDCAGLFNPVEGARTQVAATPCTMLECGCGRKRAIQ